MTQCRALIIGGGVGGLSAAVALERAGVEVFLFERASELRVEGFGLNLWPNSGRALSEIGLGDAYGRISVSLSRYLTVSSGGDIVREVDVSNWRTQYGAPASGVFRRSLSELLMSNIRSGRLHFGHTLVGLSQSRSDVIAHFSNGLSFSGDFLIGADGIHSTVRRLTFGEFSYRANPHHGYRWRGLVRLSDVNVDGEAETEVYGGRSFFGTLPIGDNAVYWFASGAGLDNWELFSENFNGWQDTHVPSVIRMTDPKTIAQTKLEDLASPPEAWVRGRVALLGDAAHAMMPDMAQGASQALIDSASLGRAISTGSVPLMDALLRYEVDRKDEAYRIQRLARQGMFADPHNPGVVVPSPIAERYMENVEI